MFSEAYRDTFRIFSTSHLVAILVILFFCLLIFLNRKTIKKKYYNMRYVFAVLTILQEVSLNVVRIINNEWTIAKSLPLQLCGIAVILTSVILVTENKKLFLNTFFVMLIGAIMAILTPAIENGYGVPHYRFFQFFFSHGMIVANFVFILFVMEYGKEFRYKNVYRNVVFLLGVAVFNFGINLITGGNYMYLMGKPGENTAFDLFGDHPWYILNILLFGIPVLLHLFYVPFYLYNKKQINLINKEA